MKLQNSLITNQRTSTDARRSRKTWRKAPWHDRLCRWSGHPDPHHSATRWRFVCLYLVSGFKHGFYFPFHIRDVILPIDELHHFSRWLLHHQADVAGYYCCVAMSSPTCGELTLSWGWWMSSGSDVLLLGFMGITVFDHLFLGLLNMDCEVWLHDRICENVVSSGRSLNPKNSKWRILGDVKRQEILGDIQIVAEIYTLSFAIVTPQTPNAHYCLWHFGPTISYMLGLSSVIIKISASISKTCGID